MSALLRWIALSTAIYPFLPTTTYAELIDNGNGLIYDSVLDITWAQPGTTLGTWDAANTWVSVLTLGGVSGWRLPYISVAVGSGPFTGPSVDCSSSTEFACRDNELGYMFYQNLSGTYGSSILTSGDPDLTLFPTLQSSYHWSGTEFNAGIVWRFPFNFGLQSFGSTANNYSSWAVHSGNVGSAQLLADLVLVNRIAMGLITPTANQRLRVDVAPLVAGVPSPDGVINAADVLIITRKALGMVNF
jgi:hypothetical protein